MGSCADYTSKWFRHDHVMRRGCGHVSERRTDHLVCWASRPLSPRNPLSFSHFLAVMAWNIDYEHDSEEVILLKKHIAEQGSSSAVLFILLD